VSLASHFALDFAEQSITKICDDLSNSVDLSAQLMEKFFANSLNRPMVSSALVDLQQCSTQQVKGRPHALSHLDVKLMPLHDQSSPTHSTLSSNALRTDVRSLLYDASDSDEIESIIFNQENSFKGDDDSIDGEG
jgi:hypothetical protein